MDLELFLIIIVVAALLALQIKFAKNGKERIDLLQTVFEGASNNKIFRTSNIYVPKKELKKVTWKNIKNNLSKYQNGGDDFNSKVITDDFSKKEAENRISSLREMLERLKDPDAIQMCKGKLQSAENEYNYKLANHGFEKVEKTLICKKEDKEKVEIILINNDNAVAEEIEQSINTYLLRNKGAVSDFNLIKDIVERNCDAIVNEIESVTPMPLYLGLAGTMSGIIIGLGIIGITTGFGEIQSVVDSLMSEVAFAMVASLVGVLCTTFISWKSRECNVIIEADKNRFYTWIQTELLPVLSSNTVSTLTLLERNLTKFNSSFGDTIKKLDVKLGEVGKTYQQQLDLLKLVEKMDVNKMATANVKVLQALNSSTGNLQGFAKYMDGTTEYLEQVRKLTGELDGYLARTGSLETIAEFYQKQMNEIASRQDAIKSTVLSVDDTMQKALADLESKTADGLSGLQKTYIKQQDAMEQLATQQGGLLKDKLDKMDAVIDFIAKMQPLLTHISKMESTINSASSREIAAINNLADSIRKARMSGPAPVQKSAKESFSIFLGKIYKKKND